MELSNDEFKSLMKPAKRRELCFQTRGYGFSEDEIRQILGRMDIPAIATVCSKYNVPYDDPFLMNNLSFPLYRSNYNGSCDRGMVNYYYKLGGLKMVTIDMILKYITARSSPACAMKRYPELIDEIDNLYPVREMYGIGEWLKKFHLLRQGETPSSFTL